MVDKYSRKLRDMRTSDSIRLQKEYEQRVYDGEDMFTLFKLWCLAFEHDMTNIDTFRAYLKVEQITLTKHQENYLTNKYFGGNK